MTKISNRIALSIAALPLRPDMRVLEIGCGPGVAARHISRILGTGKIVAIDRSPKAIAQALAGSGLELASGRLEFRQSSIEDFELKPGEARFDLAFAMRVGALDGRHPEIGAEAMGRIKAALLDDGLICIDQRPPLCAREISWFP